MLSRVAAAVMAPRTQNRRCVTGSGGRRREGRESEPQRPDMSRHLFCSAVLLLVVMMCCGSGGAQAVGKESTVSKFEWKEIKSVDGVNLDSLGAPGLLKVGSDVFAVAEAQCKKNGESNSFTGIASQIITKDNANTPVEALTDQKDKTQFLEEGTSDDPKKKVDVSRPTTVVEGNDIYMLVGKYSRTAAVKEGGGADDVGLLLVKGNVSDGSGGDKRIKWKDNDDVSRISVGELESWSRLTGGGGSGIKMEDDTLVFPVEGTKKEGEKAVSLLKYSSEDTESWKLSKGMSDGGCSDPSVVEWEKEKLMMMTACDDGRRRVYESGDMGDSWTEALGTLSRVWGNKQGEGAKGVRSGFITATIGGDENNRNVMLVTLPVYAEKADKKGELHLWLTDNTHIVDIGSVSDDDAAASSLLYKSAGSGDNNDEKLIALYEKKNGGKPSHSLWSVLLTAQLQRVKDVLATWKKVDETVSKLCLSSAEESASTGNARSTTVKITDGLVGFLSGNFSGNTWKDEYLGVNATVKKKDEGAAKNTEDTGATKTSDGVKFQGAWAEWPVGEQGENQLYHFANYNFTLVATVSIDGEPEEGGSPIPLMGVKMNDSGKTVLLGLSYNDEKKWKLLCGSGPNSGGQSVTLATETTHHVVLVVRNSTQGSAYVDGKQVGGDEACALENMDSRAVSHFYIGGGGGSAGGAGSEEEEMSVTVTNVLLYNRPLSSEEIGALNPNKAFIPPVVPENAQETQSQSSSAGQQTSGPKLLNENEGVGGGSTSPSEPSTVTTSLGKEQSEIQPPSAISSGGSKHVDVASSSDGDPTVGAEAGGAVQGDTPPQTPVDTPDTAGANAPTATDTAQVGPTATTGVGAISGANVETAEGRDGQGELHARDGEVKAAALSSSLGNVSQGNNSDAGTVCGSGLLPLLLLLGLWGFAAL
ncbi:putative trans-sialidase, Group V [Trypanosoma cruzi]|uniref:Trans-sialidase, putative n=2 Tax=Trypanosoma cruzi TaxID=5693 RepID=Q4DVE1_TRYCC|nr:trans-sialidase, putative [Trypanosoma cruzi]EAN96495.1 trans-sialidase, putative [Trypanosoma cruzi]PWV15276.1 putative trans-sialidase, Group V [Trypanosoma cruzi]RNC33299.1 putative trans-sialidase [Trypanosoma cruzi]|eukprot:XP_818346.1 trans-sialidase [Trypanosoma cruzi strain CL Brener]